VIERVTIPSRLDGAPDPVNRGYACGVVAAAIGSSATVRLSQAPPLDVPLVRERSEHGPVRLMRDDAVIATGHAGYPADGGPDAPALDVARDVARASGIRIVPGAIGDGGLLACAWTPGGDLAGDDGVVDPVFAWAVLDRPSGFACLPPGSTSVLATMTATIEAPIHAGREYVVSAWPTSHDGRRHRAGAAIHDEHGRRVAVAEALWITPRA
jgi:hypothetical protein